MAWDVAWLERQYGIDIIVVNTNSLFNAIVASPRNYRFVNPKNAGWCGTDGVVTCNLDNPNGFLFWDDLHPTTTANLLTRNPEISGLSCQSMGARPDVFRAPASNPVGLRRATLLETARLVICSER